MEADRIRRAERGFGGLEDSQGNPAETAWSPGAARGKEGGTLRPDERWNDLSSGGAAPQKIIKKIADAAASPGFKV